MNLVLDDKATYLSVLVCTCIGLSSIMARKQHGLSSIIRCGLNHDFSLVRFAFQLLRGGVSCLIVSIKPPSRTVHNLISPFSIANKIVAASQFNSHFFHNWDLMYV